MLRRPPSAQVGTFLQLLKQNRALLGSTAAPWRVNTNYQLLHTFTRLDLTLTQAFRSAFETGWCAS